MPAIARRPMQAGSHKLPAHGCPGWAAPRRHSLVQLACKEPTAEGAQRGTGEAQGAQGVHGWTQGVHRGTQGKAPAERMSVGLALERSRDSPFLRDVRKTPSCLHPGLETRAHRQGIIFSSAPPHLPVFIQPKVLSWMNFAFWFKSPLDFGHVSFDQHHSPSTQVSPRHQESKAQN